jgi:hypothetical protein
MSKIKKKQHYVWRNYLRAWAEDEKIWTFLNKQNKVYKTNLMNVVQERYFYELIDLTDFEIKILKEYINGSHESVQGWQSDFLLKFTIHTSLKKAFEKNKSDEIYKKLREIEINSMEDSHMIMENYGDKLIACRSVKELKFLETNNLRHDAIIFLCFQFFRTKNMKEKIKISFENRSEFPGIRIWNILSFFMALNVAMYVTLNSNLRFTFFDNLTPTKFLTSDQPVFIVLKDQLDDKGNVNELELYYPLSPKHALLIDFKRGECEKYQNIQINEEMVLCYNNKVIDNSDNFIFSDNKEQLDNLIKNNYDK